MKKKILLPIILILANVLAAQDISAPKLWFLQACVGNSPDFDHYIEFDISGDFNEGSEFVVLLSDQYGDFSNSTDLKTVAYDINQSSYSVLINFDYNTVEAKKYKIKVISTDPEVESPESDEFQIISVPEVSIMAQGPTEFCVGGSVVLEADVKGNIKWFKDGLLIDGETNKTIEVSETGVYSMLYDTGACTSESNAISVVATQSPVSRITEQGKHSICYPDSFTFTPNSKNTESETYEWVDENGEIVSNERDFIATESGVYRLVTLNYGVCADTSKSVELIVNKIDAEINESSVLMACFGSKLSLSSKETNPSYNYIWNKDGVLYAQGKGLTALEIDVTDNSNGFFTLTVEGEGCAFSSEAVEVKAVEEPVFNIEQGNQKLCEGSEVKLSSGLESDIYTYKWYFNSDLYSEEKEISFVLDQQHVGEYMLELSYGENCSAVQIVNVDLVLNPDAKIDLSGIVEFCEGDSIVLNSISSYLQNEKYIWLDQNNTPLSVETQLTVKNAGDYSLIVINDAVCSDTSEVVHVVMNNLPVSQILEGDSLRLCSSTTIHANSANLDNATYMWLNENGDLLGTESSLELTESSVVYLETINNSSCSDISEPFYFYREKLNSEIKGPTNYTLCSQEELVLESATVENSYSYQWYFNAEEIEGETEPRLVLKGEEATSGYYFLEISNSFCTATSNKVIVDFKAEPVAEIINGLEVGSCDGSLLKLESLETDSDYHYNWYRNDVLIEGETNSFLEFELSESSVGEYKLEISFSDCYSVISQTTNVSIKDFSIDILGKDYYEICNGESVSLEADIQNSELKYEWKRNGANINGENSSVLQVSEPGFYQLFISNESGCYAGSKLVELSSFDDVSGVNNNVFNINRGDQIEVLAYGGINYEWFVNDILLLEGDDSFVYTPSYDDQISMKIVSEQGCNKFVDIELNFNEDPVGFIQNLITPNGDGKNDYWVLPNKITKNSNIKVTILNRQGSEVYKSENYKNNWNGEHNGKQLPSSTYYYVITLDDGNVLTGSVSILR